MADNRKSIFISLGNPYREEYEKLRDHLVKIIEGCSLRPRIIEKTELSTGRPLDNITQVMSECSGAIIVAYERKFFSKGREKRGSRSESELSNVTFTTPWSQIETAMAHQREMPILMLVEEGIHEEGLIDEGYNWFLQRFERGSDPLDEPIVQNRIMQWADRVRDGKFKPAKLQVIGEDTQIGDLIKILNVKMLVQVVTLLVLIFSGGVAVGKYFR